MEGKRAQDKVGTVSYWEGSVNFQETENQNYYTHKCIVEENTQKFICLGCPVSAVWKLQFSSCLGHLYCGLLSLSL